MFVDASAIVAILAEEPGHDALRDRLERAPTPLTSGIAVFEATLAVARLQSTSLAEAEAAVIQFLNEAHMVLVPITITETTVALAAHARFGKGRHPARLNLGDCFAYACAKAHGARLLFVGDDFPQTDVAPAL
jgi:ribonuclease VapC